MIKQMLSPPEVTRFFKKIKKKSKCCVVHIGLCGSPADLVGGPYSTSLLYATCRASETDPSAQDISLFEINIHIY